MLKQHGVCPTLSPPAGITAAFTVYTSNQASLIITTKWTSSDTPTSIEWVYPNATIIADTNVIDFGEFYYECYACSKIILSTCLNVVWQHILILTFSASSVSGYETKAELTIKHFSASDHWRNPSTNVADEGAYTCKFKFANNLEKSVVITVKVLSIATDPADTTKAIGDSFSLTCEGSPAPSGVTVTSQWLKYEEGHSEGINTETSLVNETTSDASKVCCSRNECVIF